MAHQCTSCGELHEDGSNAILDGCTSCGARKFQFVDGDRETPPPVDQSETSSQPSSSTSSSVDESPVGSKPWPGEDREEGEDDTDILVAGEDDAQKSARTDTLDQDEWPDDTPQLSTVPKRDPSEVASALNEQFGSIRVVRPGKFQINLMELYESDESIISVKEDGRYVIEPAGNWEQKSV